ncbi:SurA N-terminal domain-containing protein [Chitinophaga sp.]|uniref:peptidylprolyl isomerase n=1 Tax=Chitinophaga sp. TaxID=1869181 RepID=UPI0031DAA715
MSVIQKIRDKYAVVIVVVICVAIVSFLLQDAFFGRNSLMRRSTTVGKVNGEELDFTQYQQMIQDAEAAARQQSPTGTLNEQVQQYAREQAWNQFVSEQIMTAQYDKLGIQVTENELVDQFNGKEPNPIVLQQFTDRKTGQFDRAALQQALSSVGQDQTGRMRNALKQMESYIVRSRMQEKYVSLIKGGVYYPKWLAEAQIKDNSQFANVSYVSVPYASIPDSTIAVTDGELNAYINKHKANFKSEEGRRVDYISFNALPSAQDTAAALKVLLEAKDEMDTTGVAGIENFVKRNSDIPYFDGYVAKSALMVPQKDTIASLPVGSTFGPYYDNNLIVYAKMMDRKTLPDSVKVRHILIASANPQNPGGLSDSLAKIRIDSIESAVKGGADFKALVSQYSDDPGSKENGGEYDVTPSSSFVPEFKNFALDGKTGELKVVKTQFGYHLIQIMSQKNFGPALKVAYLGKPVEASNETDSKAYAAANEFAAQNHDAKTFEKTVQEKGLNKRIADNLRPMDFVIPGIGQARELVRWAYDAKKGDVSTVFTFDGKYVVAVLTGIRAEGTKTLDEVRPEVEGLVKKEKKAEQLIAKLKSPATLEAAAAAVNQPQLKADNVNFSTPFIASMGFEPRVVGAIFNKAWGVGKVTAPIEGNAGVYVVKVDNFVPNTQSLDPVSIATQYEQTVKGTLDQGGQLYEVLKKLNKIEDNRAKFF